MKYHLEFKNHLAKFDYILHEEPILDGKQRRVSFSSNAEKKDGWYEGYVKGDFEFIKFFDFRHGELRTWEGGGASMTAAQRLDFWRDIWAQNKKQATESKLQGEEAGQEAARIWNAATVEQAAHPYTSKKKIPTDSFRFRLFNGNRELLVPMMDASGAVKNVQRILPDGDKKFIKGAKVASLYSLAGEAPPKDFAGEIAIAEGIATAESVRKITGYTCFAAMSAGNLLKVAEIVRDAYSNACVVIAGDDDRMDKDGTPRPLKANAGRVKAYESALKVGALALFPIFAHSSSRGTDWNDVYCEEGEEAAALAWVRARTIAELDRKLLTMTEPEFLNEVGDLLSAYGNLGLKDVTQAGLVEKRSVASSQTKAGKDRESGGGGAQSDSPAYIILHDICSEEVETWHDEEGKAYATFSHGDRTINAPVEGLQFRDFLYVRYRARTGGGPAPGRESIAACIASMAALARHASPMRPVHFRVAYDPTNSDIWLDLAREDGQVVKIGTSGWQLTKTCPLKFVSSGNKSDLPIPKLDPEVVGFFPLWEILNVAVDDRCLIAGFLLGAMQTSAPGFGLSLFGQMGAAKSVGTRILRRILDPQAAIFQTLNSRNVDQLGLTCLRQLIPCFENLSWLDAQSQDLMCSLTTGLSVKARKLYTDEDLVAYTVRRVWIINGINNVCSRSDLAQRTIPVCLLPPPEHEDRKTERAVEKMFESCKAHLLATILDAVVMALNNRAKSAEFLAANKFDHRMADALEFITAGEEALGFPMGTFIRRLQELQIEAAQEALDAHPVVVAIESLLLQAPGGKWRGSHEEILKEMFLINPDAKRSQFVPHDNTSLGNWFKRETPRMRMSHGIVVSLPVKERVDGRRLRFREIHRIDLDESPSSETGADAT
ncbi:MAG: toprim domain-containing protein [Verrucomicrobiota bacterium]